MNLLLLRVRAKCTGPGQPVGRRSTNEVSLRLHFVHSDQSFVLQVNLNGDDANDASDED